MNRLALLIFIFIQLNKLNLYSQNTLGGLIQDVNTLATRNMTTKVLYNEIQGSPYYSPEYVKGVVHLKDGNYAALNLRYDLFQDEIEFIKDTKTLWLIKNDIKYINYGKEILYVTDDFEQNGKLSYYFVPDTGKCKLYIRKKVDYFPEVPPKGYSDAIPERFEKMNDEFYLQMGVSPAQKIKNKKGLETFLVNNQPALDYVKKGKLRADKPEDLQKLVAFLNKE
jgi:hypothetical protein